MATCTKSKSREAVDGGAGGTELPHRMHGRQDSRLKQNARIRTGGQAGTLSRRARTASRSTWRIRDRAHSCQTCLLFCASFFFSLSSRTLPARHGRPGKWPRGPACRVDSEPGHYLALLWRLRPGRIGPPCRPRLRWRAAAPKLVYRDTRTSCLQMPAIVCWLPDKVPSTSRLGADSLHPGPPRVYSSCPDRTGTFFQYHHLSLSLPLYY